jgi:transportin-3
MASTTPQEGFEVQTVLAAMLTMRSGENEKKKVAVDYLGRFQKSVSPTHPPLPAFEESY